MTRRFNTVKIDKSEITTQGFLKSNAILTRTGVFTYRTADGRTIRELRHPSEVFKKESLDTLAMCPLTDDHPKEFVTPENVDRLSIGWVSNSIAMAQDGLISADVVVATKKAIDKVDLGKVELSCGYLADLVEEKGTFDGEPYDYKQTNIRYNHVALVDRGRAGPQVRLRLDSEDAEMVDVEVKDKTEVPNMEKIKIGDKEYAVEKELKDAFTKMQDEFSTKLKDAEEKVKTKDNSEKNDSDSLKLAQAEIVTLKARADALQVELDKKKDFVDAAKLDALVEEKKALEVFTAEAKEILGAEAKLDGKSEEEILKEVVAKTYPQMKIDGYDKNALKAVYEVSKQSKKDEADKKDQISKALSGKDLRTDSDFDSKKAREEAFKKDQEAWKQPLAMTKK